MAKTTGKHGNKTTKAQRDAAVKEADWRKQIEPGKVITSGTMRIQVIGALEERLAELELNSENLGFAKKSVDSKIKRMNNMLRDFIRQATAPAFNFVTGEIIEQGQMTIDQAVEGQTEREGANAADKAGEGDEGGDGFGNDEGTGNSGGPTEE